MCQVYPERRIELDAYLAIIFRIIIINQRYGRTLFYEYYKAFSAKSAQCIAMVNTRLDWSITDTDFGGHKSLSYAICSSHGHTTVLCLKTATTSPVPFPVHGAEHVSHPSDLFGRPLVLFNGMTICNNCNKSVCSFANCRFSHIVYLNEGCRSDLKFWLFLLFNWNGISFLTMTYPNHLILSNYLLMQLPRSGSGFFFPRVMVCWKMANWISHICPRVRVICAVRTLPNCGC